MHHCLFNESAVLPCEFALVSSVLRYFVTSLDG
jgi:hypothetical protein